MCFSNKTERVFVNYAKKKRTIKIWRLVYKQLCLKYFIFVACFKLLNHTIRVTSVFLDKLGRQNEERQSTFLGYVSKKVLTEFVYSVPKNLHPQWSKSCDSLFGIHVYITH